MSSRRKILFALLPVLALLLAVEIASYFFPLHEAPEDAEVAGLAFAPEVGWRLKPGFRGELYGAERRVTRRGLLAVDGDRKNDLPRVLALGDSRTFGNGVASEAAWPEVLDGLLPEADVVNLGVPGYTSFQGLARLRQVLGDSQLRPDLVIFAFGFNDRRYVLSPQDTDGPETFERLAGSHRWAGLAGWLRSVRLLRSWLNPKAAPAADSAEEGVDLGEVLPRVAPEQYGENLRLAAELCRQEEIPLVLLFLPDNPRQSAALERGTTALRQQRREVAEGFLRAAVERDNTFSDAARLALAELERGRGNEAEASRLERGPRRIVSVTGGTPILPAGPYRRITREVAEVSAVAYVDGAKSLATHPEYFLDFCHVNEEGHRQLADQLASVLQGRLSAN